MKRGTAWNPKRRRFLRSAAVAGVAGPAISCVASKIPWRYFTAEEGTTVAAVCGRLIPDDEFPGAVWAGAVRYLDRQLCGHLRKHREAYRNGLAALNQISRQHYGAEFAALNTERQIALLKAIENGKAPGKQFFALILNHTMQSYYGDPRHGGNRDGVGYRSLGINITPVRGRSKDDLTGSGGAT